MANLAETTTQDMVPYQFGLRLSEHGHVVGVGDGIVWIRGLPSARMDELICFEDGSTGLVFQLASDLLGAILLSQRHGVRAGMGVKHLGRALSIGAGDELLGRVVDPLGNPLDGMRSPEVRSYRCLESEAPPIIARDFVTRPLVTGSRAVDALIPIGRGQRQLLIGDDGTGKSALALDAVINQTKQDVLCVIVLIGQPRSTVAGVVSTLRDTGALPNTVVVVAEANALPGFRYLAPFAGCALAEHWMHSGRDVLIVYDDLTRHAQSYRELSLLLHRPPGREAFPGDIFYLHSRLLERSAALLPEFGGGSMTALPIIETRQGELSAFIPTNLISITDGQIYFDARLFAQGTLPAIDIGRSVSRIGGKAQHESIRQAASHTRLDYLQFLELEPLARFGSRLEPALEGKLLRGRILRELLRQDRLSPVSQAQQLAWLLAYRMGLFESQGPGAATTLLQRVLSAATGSGLGVDDPRETWSAMLREALSS